MSSPILSTKLFIPTVRSHSVERTRLLERMNEGVGRCLSLISASAGFGKTTLVIQWITHYQKTVAWFSLDENDNDTHRFLVYFIKALQTVVPNLAENVVVTLQSSQTPDLDNLITILLNEISATNQEIILVLDDYHLLDCRSVDEMMIKILEYKPPRFHIIITSREDPNFPLAKLRARNQLNEIRVADLRFTQSETAEFLSVSTDLNLASEHVASLESRTEGWIVGLQLAAISLREQKNVSAFVNSFAGSHRFVLDYLLEEVLNQQTESVQNFLLRTSVLERISSALCDAVLQDKQQASQEYLEHCEQSNLFLIPLDVQRQWYRYHHLFADILRLRLQKLNPSLVNQLYQRASEWCYANGYEDDAIRYALKAKHFDRAADLLELAWPGMERYVMTAPWLTWAKQIPQAILLQRPVLATNYAWALLDVGELEQSEHYLQLVEAMLEIANDFQVKLKQPALSVYLDEQQFQDIPVTLVSARSFLALAQGQLVDAVKHAQQVLSMAAANDIQKRFAATALMGLVYCTKGDLDAAYQTFYQSMAGMRKAGFVNESVGGCFILGDIKMIQARLDEAERIYLQTKQSMDVGEPLPQGAAYIYLGLSKIHREQGQQQLADDNLNRAIDIDRETPLQLCQYRIALAQVRAAQAQKEFELAVHYVNKAERLYYRNVVPEFQPLDAIKARLWIQQGYLDDANSWATEKNLSVDNVCNFLSEFDNITYLRLLLVSHQHNQQQVQLQQLLIFSQKILDAAMEAGRLASVMELYLMQALIHQQAGDESAAHAALVRSFDIAHQQNYVQLYLDEGPVVIKLLAKLNPHERLLHFVELLRAKFANHIGNEKVSPEIYTGAAQKDTPEYQAFGLIEPLSKRELQVLRLIEQGLSNREISERLYLALSSVKGHNQKIFNKLQVQRRTEAVAKARELSIL
ncbi:MAG: LuxR C-terminal-related transcriptional regulator [Gammaproteobacteria bacterium]|nr:LuxR C-terminal-related transcriptional regulator [Gammaproteobacteria bacterium]